MSDETVDKPSQEEVELCICGEILTPTAEHYEHMTNGY